jgi:cell fate regulator YaaT (PSP1 superfamily)
MPIVVGVAFRPVTKVYYFDPAGVEDLQPGERVIVDTARGRTLGHVVFSSREVAESEISGTLKPVVRRATAWDMVQQDQMDHKEAETLAICRQRAAALGLAMKVIKVEHAFDGSSLVVYFTAEQRVDFRNLVHDLAQVLHTRVEMRQVGVRDEAKFLGGFGKCGRELCCAAWLREFTPVSIKMAKTQDLPLNSSEVSGVCGRLLCCLSYENDFYTEARKQMPRLNSILETPQGPGKVKQLQVLRNSVIIQVEGPGETTTFVDVVLPEPAPIPPPACATCPARRAPLATADEPVVMAEPVEEVEAEAETGADVSREIVEEPSAATVIAEPVEPSRPKPVEGAEKPAQPRRRSRARRRRR